ncbi:MAG: type II toxin-antitoxin system VapC family toxin [Bacteroidota bacterium]|nr:type II toxin-antitoxin system VapC family toxin [Bacteroidota bacterium]
MNGDRVVYYFDSSALIKRYVQEEGSEQVQSLFSAPVRTASTILTYVEVRAALGKAIRMDRLDDGEAARAWDSFCAEWESVIRVGIDQALLQQAADAAERHSLRAYDAVHLASALLLRGNVGVPVVMATFDYELWKAARQRGMQVFPQSLPRPPASTQGE